jgi:hypothetical protein
MSGYRDACARLESTGCPGFAGAYDRRICDQPYPCPYRVETSSYGPSTSEPEGGQK